MGPFASRGVPSKPCEYLVDRVACRLPLKGLIEEAYQLKEIELAGPEWIRDGMFNFQATMPQYTKKDDARLMLQEALADRFGLRVHREKREIPVYALVAASRV